MYLSPMDSLLLNSVTIRPIKCDKPMPKSLRYYSLADQPIVHFNNSQLPLRNLPIPNIRGVLSGILKTVQYLNHANGILTHYRAVSEISCNQYYLCYFLIETRVKKMFNFNWFISNFKKTLVLYENENKDDNNHR